MKALFNGDCSRCETFKPRCARVNMITWPPKAGSPVYSDKLTILCADCRKECKNRFKLAEAHR